MFFLTIHSSGRAKTRAPLTANVSPKFMAYDYNFLVEKIIGAIALDGEVADRMKIVIDECARQHPHPDWAIFSNIDFDRDRAALDSWLPTAFSNPDNGNSSSGLWFGLFNPANVSGEASADVYVAVAPDFDGSSIDWTGGIDGLDAPNYLESVVLAKIYEVAYNSTSGLKNAAEYPLTLAYGGIVAHSILQRNTLPMALQRLEGAAVGFDSGDVLYLGEFVDSKFISNVRIG